MKVAKIKITFSVLIWPDSRFRDYKLQLYGTILEISGLFIWLKLKKSKFANIEFREFDQFG